MSLTRIQIVDDSVVNRQMLKKCLSTISDFEVVAVAHNGRVALAQIPQCNPDIVILDVEMPEMNGLETLQKIREKYKDLIVIMFSALTEKGASITVQALSMGANDYVAKPNLSHHQDNQALEKFVFDNLVTRIQAFKKKPLYPSISTKSRPIEHNSQKINITKIQQRIDVVGIGISTGGPNALARMFTEFNEFIPVPIMIVQHMPPIFTKYLAERLDQLSLVKVYEAEEGMFLEANTAYIAPGDYHMQIKNCEEKGQITLNQRPPENSCRPSVDVLFRSLAKFYGSNTLGVVMTGMGQDGLRGCEYLSDAGGQIIVQDKASSVIWSMPGHVAEAGLADKILDLDELPHEIIQRIKSKR